MVDHKALPTQQWEGHALSGQGGLWCAINSELCVVYIWLTCVSLLCTIGPVIFAHSISPKSPLHWVRLLVSERNESRLTAGGGGAATPQEITARKNANGQRWNETKFFHSHVNGHPGFLFKQNVTYSPAEQWFIFQFHFIPNKLSSSTMSLLVTAHFNISLLQRSIFAFICEMQLHKKHDTVELLQTEK